MSDNWMDDMFGKASVRPDHPDLAKISEVLLRMDAGIDPANNTEDQNQAAWEKLMDELGIDREVVSWSSLQRAMRAAGVQTKMDLAIKAPQVMMLSAVWLDGFAAGALFERKGQ